MKTLGRIQKYFNIHFRALPVFAHELECSSGILLNGTHKSRSSKS